MEKNTQKLRERYTHAGRNIIVKRVKTRQAEQKENKQEGLKMNTSWEKTNIQKLGEKYIQARRKIHALGKKTALFFS